MPGLAGVGASSASLRRQVDDDQAVDPGLGRVAGEGVDAMDIAGCCSPSGSSACRCRPCGRRAPAPASFSVMPGSAPAGRRAGSAGPRPSGRRTGSPARSGRRRRRAGPSGSPAPSRRPGRRPSHRGRRPARPSAFSAAKRRRCGSSWSNLLSQVRGDGVHVLVAAAGEVEDHDPSLPTSGRLSHRARAWADSRAGMMPSSCVRA